MLKELVLVVSIIDGDTVKVLDSDKVQHTVRLAYIDAPERKQPYGRKSAQILADLVGKQQVFINCPKKDRYKRWICTLDYDGVDINKRMVEVGAAWVYRKYYSGTDYLTVEREARQAKKGLWQTSEYAIPPWEWRKRK